MRPDIKSCIDAFDDRRTGEGNPTWNISPEVGNFLYRTITEARSKRALEIGTSTGYSALWLAAGLTLTGGHLYTIESHAERYEAARNLFDTVNLTDTIITQIKGHAPEVLSEVGGSFDFVFLDATKVEHRSYIEALEHRILPGGIIITDNVDSHRDALSTYLDFLSSHPDFSNQYLPIGTGLLISTKIP